MYSDLEPPIHQGTDRDIAVGVLLIISGIVAIAWKQFCRAP